MKSTLEDLQNRRSIRAYKPEQIKDEELNAIVTAGTWAASGASAQSAVIVVVQDKALITQIEALNARVLNTPEAKPFYGAPTILAVLVDKTKPTPLEDGSLVLGNLMLAAYAIGVGSCWIHRAKQVFEFEEGKALLKRWGLSEDYVGVGFCILGYAAGEAPKPAPRKEGYIIKAT
ncbi:MAG: nitroreductase family protein [Treponema sp.]|jgi:nitroreductase|nr:nitroreductase family protein [Treponema sp.]